MTSQPTPSTVPDVPRYADELAEELEEVEHRAAAPERFFDREASWLDFNTRVLELVEDEDPPLLELVRFVAIFARNFDEFFMVRVAGLRRRVATGISVSGASGLSDREQLELISGRAHDLAERHARLFQQVLAPALRQEEICLLHYDELSGAE